MYMTAADTAGHHFLKMFLNGHTVMEWDFANFVSTRINISNCILYLITTIVYLCRCNNYFLHFSCDILSIIYYDVPI